MADSLKAIIIEVTAGSLSNSYVKVRGALGFFPEDALGGSDENSAGKPIKLQIGAFMIETDIDEGKAIFRERGAIRQFFEKDDVAEGDLLLIERIGSREYSLSKASKRAFKYHL